MSRRIVVVGTDTGVGKTYVTAAIARALTTAFWRVVTFKPVESGCASVEPGVDEDGVLLACATRQRTPLAALQRLRAPLAPPLAARRAGVMLRPDAWFARIRACRVPLQLIEAAGGLLSPLADRLDGLTLAERLDAEVLVVAADRLGTVSHTRLVVEHLEARGWSISSERRRLLGVVLSAPAVRDASTGSNADLLAGWINSPIFTIDRGGRPDVRLLARVLHG